MAELIPFLAPIVGGLLGHEGTQTQQTQNKDLPDWLKPYVTGSGGLLDSATSLFKQQNAQGGLNPLQRAGMEAQRQFLTSDQYGAGYDQMRQQGMDLMGRPVAGNPFSAGGTPSGPNGGFSMANLRASGGTPHPSSNTANFLYSINPTLSQALQPIAAAAVTQPATTQPSMDDIIAELQRRLTAQNNGGTYAGGGNVNYGGSGL